MQINHSNEHLIYQKHKSHSDTLHKYQELAFSKHTLVPWEFCTCFMLGTALVALSFTCRQPAVTIASVEHVLTYGTPEDFRICSHFI